MNFWEWSVAENQFPRMLTSEIRFLGLACFWMGDLFSSIRTKYIFGTALIVLLESIVTQVPWITKVETTDR